MACEQPFKNQKLPITGECICRDNSSQNENNFHSQDEINKSIFTISMTRHDEDKLNYEINWDNKENCQQLILKYYLKAEDFENKCTILHRNLQEVKDAWDRAKEVRNDALKEKENMTIKYAISEKNVLDERKLKETLQKKCEELSKENNTLKHKLQAMIEEKTRICQVYDHKIDEQKGLHTENKRIKNDNCILENELKLCQKALKQHAELYSKSQTIIENLSKLKSTNQVEQDTKASENSMENFTVSQKNKEYKFREQIAEEQSSLTVVIKSKINDEEKQVETPLSPLESLKLKYYEVTQENTELFQKLKQLKSEKLEMKNAFNIWVDPLLQNEADLQISPSQLGQCNMPLINQSEHLKALNANFSLLKSKNTDLEIEIETYKHREAEALLFTQDVTYMAMKLQSDYNILEKNVEQLRDEVKSLKKVNVEYKSQCDALIVKLRKEKENNFNEKIKNSEEINYLSTDLSTLKVQNHQLKQQIYDWQEEIAIIKRKHKFSLREMQNQLGYKNTKFDRHGDTGQCCSLLGNCSPNYKKSCSNDQVEVIQPEAKIEKFIERIINLQRINARKSEKLDFLEYQVNTLISELQRKSKLLQIYMLQDRTNALTSNMMDDCKSNLKNGIMASIANASVADKHLTLELSLQINQKLQAVLEDALLENIILKENIDTLGHNIEKLNQQLEN